MKLWMAAWLACAATWAQAPRIEIIDYYGVRKVSPARLQEALGVKEKDPLPPSKAAAEERLEAVEGVVAARLEAVCCEAGGAILFVGIQERGAQQFETREAPASETSLPEDLVEAYREFLESYRESAIGATELSVPPELRVKLAELAQKYLKNLAEAVRSSADEDQRAIAAQALAFVPGPEASEALQYALRDPEEAVRQNALRSLMELAAYAAAHPESEVRISATWPVEMLHSLAWGDRKGAAELLVRLSENRDPRVLDLIRERAAADLAEMARWKSLQHALAPYVVLGRIAGWTEAEIQKSWSEGDREQAIAAMEKKLRIRR